eukprot:IDg13943t1
MVDVLRTIRFTGRFHYAPCSLNHRNFAAQYFSAYCKLSTISWQVYCRSMPRTVYTLLTHARSPRAHRAPTLASFQSPRRNGRALTRVWRRCARLVVAALRKTALHYGAVARVERAPPRPAAYPSPPARAWLAAAGAVTVALAVRIFAHGLHASQGRPGASSVARGALAICYSGQVRALARVYEQNVIVFRSFDPRAVFFAHVDLKDCVALPSGARYTRNHSAGEFELAWKAMRVQTPSYYHANDIPTPPRASCVVDAVGGTPGRYPKHYHDLFAAARCFDIIREEERRR